MNHDYEDDGKPMCGRCGRPANDRVHVRGMTEDEVEAWMASIYAPSEHRP